MEIKISGTQKELTDLALTLQNRQTVTFECDSRELAKQAVKGIRVMNESQSQNPDKADFAAAQKIITEASKKVGEEKSVKSDFYKQESVERTFDDVKRHFQKMLESIKTMEDSKTPSPFRKENT